MMYVTDTHALLWFQTNNPQLSRKAREIFEGAESGENLIFIPSIVLLELLSILEKKKIGNFEAILQELEDSYNYEIYPLELEIIKEVSRINTVKELHDRIIIASSKILNCELITKDEEIIQSKEVNCIW